MTAGPPTPIRGADQLPGDAVAFAHPSERDFARVLDFYGVEWRYEPRTFVLREDADGNPLEGFSPDFYLPDLDLYIELTTLKQRLVTKKNRKLRELRERYPGVNVMILYRRDWQNLAVKYGMDTAAGDPVVPAGTGPPSAA